MRNFVQPGKSMTFTAPGGGVVSGNVYKIGQLVGVAATTKAAGLPFVLHVEGVFIVPKATGQAWSEGALVYWNGTAMTTTSAGGTLAGSVAKAGQSVDTTGYVRLNGIAIAAS